MHKIPCAVFEQVLCAAADLMNANSNSFVRLVALNAITSNERIRREIQATIEDFLDSGSFCLVVVCGVYLYVFVLGADVVSVGVLSAVIESSILCAVVRGDNSVVDDSDVKFVLDTMKVAPRHLNIDI